MKVALIMAGDLRNFDECYPSLRDNILSEVDCDIYLHSYFDDRVEEAKSMLDPVDYITEDRNDVNIQHVINPNRTPSEVLPKYMNQFYQWRNVKKAFDIIPEDNDYEAVIKTRYDISYSKNLWCNDFDFSEFNIPSGGDWRRGMFDMFCISSYNNMKYYCSMYDQMQKYHMDGVPLHSEILLRYHLENSKSSVSRFHYEIFYANKSLFNHENQLLGHDIFDTFYSE